METPVFARRSSPLDRTLSAGAYNLVIGLTLCWGFWVNWWMVGNIPVESIRSIHPWLFFGGYFASCLSGAWLFHRSNQPWVSFLGYNLVVALVAQEWKDKIVGFLCAAGGQGSYMSVMGLADSLMLDFRCVVVPRFVYATGAAFEGDVITDAGVAERVVGLAKETVRLAGALQQK